MIPNCEATERRRQRDTACLINTLIITFAFLALALGCCLIPFTIININTTSQFDGIVIDKPVIEGNIHFTIRHNGNDEVFKNSNNLILYKTNSADLISQIEIGRRYRFTVTWFRFKPLNQYRNIISATPLPGG